MNKEAIRNACESFLETWDRSEWMADNGSWASEDDESISSESDYIVDVVIDPDDVFLSADSLGVSSSYQEWDCREGWQAMRAGDALVLNWYRNPTTTLRHARDLYVVIDSEFFVAD